VLLKALGTGATGDVHLARPFDDGAGIPSPVVIKRLHDRLAANDDFVKRFVHEAELAMRVDSAHVAKVFDVGVVGESIYIAMEFVRGWSASQLLKAQRDAGRPISLPSAIDFAVGALEGLGALHNAIGADGRPLGIVHRDVSPKNLMLGEDGLARVIDLGLGKSNLQNWKTRTGAVMGSVGYMPPEQVRAHGVDYRADLYSLGVVLFELLTLENFVARGSLASMLSNSMRPRFRPPSKTRPDLPATIDTILERALAYEPRDRFQSALDFAAALRGVAPERDDQTRTLVGELELEDLGGVHAELAHLMSMTLPAPEPTAVRHYAQRGVTSTAVGLEPTSVRPSPATPSPPDTGLEPTSIRPSGQSDPARVMPGVADLDPNTLSVGATTSAPRSEESRSPSASLPAPPGARARSAALALSGVGILILGIVVDRTLLAPRPNAAPNRGETIEHAEPTATVPTAAAARPTAVALPAARAELPADSPPAPKPAPRPLRGLAAQESGVTSQAPAARRAQHPAASTPMPAAAASELAPSESREGRAKDTALLYRRIIALQSKFPKETADRRSAEQLLERFNAVASLGRSDQGLSREVERLESIDVR
jgi:serine/threonine-protein kinase